MSVINSNMSIYKNGSILDYIYIFMFFSCLLNKDFSPFSNLVKQEPPGFIVQ